MLRGLFTYKFTISQIQLLAFFFCLSSCKKEGIGGEAKIQGYVHVKKWNATFTQFIGEYPGKDVYVYIVYGDHIGYDQRLKTDYNGMFEFRYLYKGNYKVYAYSRDSAYLDASGTKAIVKEININKRDQRIYIDTLLIIE